MMWILVVAVLVLTIALGVISIVMFGKITKIEQQVNTLLAEQNEIRHSFDRKMDMLHKSMSELLTEAKNDENIKAGKQRLKPKRKGLVICKKCYEAFSINDKTCPKCGTANDHDL